MDSSDPGSGISFSIVVPVFNMAKTIERTISSIIAQLYDRPIQIIVVDGASTDGTLEALNRHRENIDILLSEPDDGLYDAINKGIRRASGDVIAILNGDDYYADETVLAGNALPFSSGFRGILFGDIEFFREDSPQRTVRRYSSSRWTPHQLRSGWMPPHPTVFAHRDVYAAVGEYRTDYAIAADYEFLVRALLIEAIPYQRIDRVIVRMQLGGLSTAGLGATIAVTREIVRACRENGVATSYMRVLGRLPLKLRQFLITGSN